MAGLSVLLESHKNNYIKPQIISKATLIHNPKISSSYSSSSPAAMTTAATAASYFLQRCSLCHKDLAEGKDIYMYRGDRAFCSVDCRCRQIFMDEDAGGGSYCAKGTAAAAARTSRRSATGGGGFAY